MKFYFFIYIFFLFSCSNLNTTGDTNKKNNNIKMKVISEPKIIMNK